MQGVNAFANGTGGNDLENGYCRFCGQELNHTLADLGLSPLANEYLKEGDLARGQMFYPLKVQVCSQCFLAQAEQIGRAHV